MRLFRNEGAMREMREEVQKPPDTTGVASDLPDLPDRPQEQTASPRIAFECQKPAREYDPKPRTWKEYKAMIEAAGVTDDTELEYIDIERGKAIIVQHLVAGDIIRNRKHGEKLSV